MAPTALADVLPDRIVSKAAQPADEPHVHGGEDLTPMQAISHGDVSLQGLYLVYWFVCMKPQLTHPRLSQVPIVGREARVAAGTYGCSFQIYS